MRMKAAFVLIQFGESYEDDDSTGQLFVSARHHACNVRSVGYGITRERRIDRESGGERRKRSEAIHS